MPVVVAAAAVAAAAAESAFTKLASRPLLSLGGVKVGLAVGLGGLPPMRSLKSESCVTRFGLDTLGWTELNDPPLAGTIGRL